MIEIFYFQEYFEPTFVSLLALMLHCEHYNLVRISVKGSTPIPKNGDESGMDTLEGPDPLEGSDELVGEVHRDHRKQVLVKSEHHGHVLDRIKLK